MQFRDLITQYKVLKPEIEKAIFTTLDEGHFISGRQVKELEILLAEYVGVKHCIACANGTDAISLALATWGIGSNDAVFVPDFTFFSTGECPVSEGATPVFVDIDKDTYNINPVKLEEAILKVKADEKYEPKVVITVDLFGQCADYDRITSICDKYNLLLLEDGAQGFGASIRGKMACSFGDISTTSFFPAKPLGCYGDGGAIFTDNDEWAEVIRSLCVHGKGKDKYDNIRIGRNSRLDTLQAAILIEKLKAFREYELENVNKVAHIYSNRLKDFCEIPKILDGYVSSWAQYTIKAKDENERRNLQDYLIEQGIPTNIYYSKPMHNQRAFKGLYCSYDTEVTEDVCRKVISLPIGPYMTEEEVQFVCDKINDFYINMMGKYKEIL